ncbi:MAG: 23S rRNA (adenine(2030)-N(6))-methyltransferase RlmJ [Treponema sp.]
MFGYVHDFHAGNHGDVLKHAVLTLILEYLNRKDKPYTFFDTHAGSGVYNLSNERSAKTGECVNGVLRLREFYAACAEKIPEALKPYITELERYDGGIYPGSPRIEADFMRSKDKLILSELHPAAYKTLCSAVTENLASIHFRDGWEMLGALTPPKTNRGAALIDPSYEIESDYAAAAETVIKVHRKWRSGIIILWYPLLSYKIKIIENMKDRIIRAVKSFNTAAEILNAELCVNSSDSHKEVPLNDLDKNNAPRMYGSGLLIINSPWKLDESLRGILPFLADCLGIEKKGNWSLNTKF